ncbi:hypothetical protein LZ30DRAFT_689361 [Colletotrichum cereale]|nr:hypothetical protein LZ30DRAFT_689361 [Colletotrichum cereale]
MPLVDSSDGVNQLYEETKREIEGADEDGGLDGLDLRVTARLFLVDEQAVKEWLVKLLWLDAHGECLWWNKINSAKVKELTSAWEACASMQEIVEGGAGEDSEKGAVLRF